MTPVDRRPTLRRRSRSAGLLAALLVALAACSSAPRLPTELAPLPSERPADTLFLIGDAGAPKLPPTGSEIVEPVLRALAGDVRRRCEEIGADRTAVVFLGDNIYPTGMPAPGHEKREWTERILDAQIAAVGPARGYFIAGNHDWDKYGADAWTNVIEQGEYLESVPRCEMQPPAGCPGPTRVDFGDHVRLLFLDKTAWHPGLPPAGPGPRACPGPAREGDALEELRRELESPDGRAVVLLSHYPLLSAGPHGGHFGWREHLFPLTKAHEALWIPLPIVGSVYPLSRQLGISPSDIMHDDYERYVRRLDELFLPGAPVLTAAGHDHSLQLHRDAAGRLHAVSGAGSTKKITGVGGADTALMARAAPGYMRLDVYGRSELVLTVIEVDEAGRPEPIYRLTLP